ncbi:MAG: PIN domain-containing protein [Chitinivibrionales bacterium]|nr:PIN domain-containing protein [Chitinivibrionales bacterium]
MNALLDTNIIIHREAARVINKEIGLLFNWLDTLHVKKCVHPITVEEIEKHGDGKTVETFKTKIENYHILKTVAPLHPSIVSLFSSTDKAENDRNDTILINEVFAGRVHILITEDKRIHEKAISLNISEKLFTIESFIEKAVSENPSLVDYKTLSVKKEFFGNVNVACTFFDSFRADYPGFDKWFNRKAEEPAYICRSSDNILAFLYVKHEGENETYRDIEPIFSPKRRLKIGSFKVELNGFKLGERFLKIVFDNAIRFRVEEIYVTIFINSPEHERLISILELYGFRHYGYKISFGKRELVFVRPFEKSFDFTNPKLTFPFFSRNSNVFLVPIWPDYHTSLLPDSILSTESPAEFIENEPFRNAIGKVYISRSIERNLQSGDIIIFYRTGGYHKSVITTIGVVESMIDQIPSETIFIEKCGKRSVLPPEELSKWWNYNPQNRPFIVNFLYAYSFPHRINLQRLIELGIIPDYQSAPRGFYRIKPEQFNVILKETNTNESIIVD